jgi:hypothetical protein
MKLLTCLFAFAQTTAFAFFDTSHPAWDSLQMETKAQNLYTRAYRQHSGDETFTSLSPELLIAISRAYIYQQQNNPDLLSNGAYYEFGLFRGVSLWFAEQAGREFVSSEFFYYGFDSFEGLPSISNDFDYVWQPGEYACSLEQVKKHFEENNADLSKIHLIKGWFSQSLFTTFSNQYAPKPAAIFVIDSDLFESCAEILAHFGPHLPKGCVMLLDDFNTDNKNDHRSERKALREYMMNHPEFAIRHLFSFGWHGEAFEVI